LSRTRKTSRYFAGHTVVVALCFTHHCRTAQNPRQFVQKIIEFRRKHSAIVGESFKKDRSFVKALKTVLEESLNADSRSAQFLAMFLEEVLGQTDNQEFQNQVDQARVSDPRGEKGDPFQ